MPRRGLAERDDERGLDVDAQHVVAVARKVDRDAPGAASDLEDGPARAKSELAPEREVGFVRAVFDVVPDHRLLWCADAHSQYAFASPRSERSVLSSRSAV